MMIVKSNLDLASCLIEGAIADAAQDAIVAARKLGQTRWASLVRAWSIAYTFDRMEAIFASGEEPLLPVAQELDDLIEFMNVAVTTGFAALGDRKGEALGVVDDVGRLEVATGEHYGKLFEQVSPTSYWDEPLRLLSLRLTRNDLDPGSIEGKEVLDSGCGGGRYTVAWGAARDRS